MEHSASRALALLRSMNLRPVSSVRDLARETGISKPSVVRLLAILIDDGYVQRAAKAGSYSLTRNVLQLTAGYRDDSTIAREAGPIMGRLTADHGWPTALGLFEQGAMVVRHSTIPTSPLAWYRTTLYNRLPLLWSAMGQVYLAFSDERTRVSLLATCDDEGTAPAERSPERFAQIRERGYALRVPGADHPTISVSVPLMAGPDIAAALSMTIYGRAMSPVEAVRRYVTPLRNAAKEIVAASGIVD